jgi:hypothetical protein
MIRIFALAGTALCTLAANSARATLFYQEPFAYPDGNLINALYPSGGFAVTGTNGPNMPNPPFWNGTHAGFGGQPTSKVQINDGKMIIGFGLPGSEDPNLPTGATLQQGQTWYADLYVPPEFTGAQHVLSRFFVDPSNISGMFFVQSHTAGGGPTLQTYRLGLSSFGSGIPDVYWPTELPFNSTHRIVVAYTLDPDNSGATQDSVARLWVDPIDESSPSVVVNNLNSVAATSFAFHWGGPSSSNKLIDNLSLGTTFIEVVPEPATSVLAVFAFLGVLRLNARRPRV